MLWLKWRRLDSGSWRVECLSYQVSIHEAALELHSFDEVYDIICDKFYEEHNVILDS